MNIRGWYLLQSFDTITIIYIMVSHITIDMLVDDDDIRWYLEYDLELI